MGPWSERFTIVHAFSAARGSSRARFSLVFIAALVSGLGDGLIPAAFAIESHRLDSSGRALSAVLIALWLGRFLSSAWVQRVPAPRFPARWMVVSDGVRLAAQWLLLLWLVTVGTHQVVAFVLSSFLYGLATSFFGPARFSLLSALFSAQERAKINGLLSMLGDVLFVAGPLIGTLLTLQLGFNAVLLIDGLTFLGGMAVVLAFWSVTAKAPQDADEEEISAEPAAGRLPSWVNEGMATWLVAMFTIGFLGAAAPTLVMNTFGEATSGLVAAGAAVGALLGSAAAMSRWAGAVPWPLLQGIALGCLAVQVTALILAPWVGLVIAAALLAGVATTAAGVAWDVLGQSLPSPALVHQFATRDQLMGTIGVPLGMVVYAATSWQGAPALVVCLLVVGVWCATRRAGVPGAA